MTGYNDIFERSQLNLLFEPVQQELQQLSDAMLDGIRAG